MEKVEVSVNKEGGIMKTMTQNNRRNYFSLLVIAFCSSSSVYSQELNYDHPDKKKFTSTVIFQNGEEKMMNGYGEVIYGEEYFSRPLAERVDLGYTYVVSSRGVNYPEKSNEENTGVRFNITFKDVILGNGTGFDDPTYGSQRRDALSAAFRYFSDIINNSGQADVQIDPSFFQNISPGSTPPLATSVAPSNASRGFNDCLAFRHLNSGTDPSNSLPDGILSFNFGNNINYNYDYSGAPTNSQYDFYTVAIHEIMHMLGFTSYCNADGTSQAANNVFTAFDEFLLNPSYSPLLVTSGSGSGLTVAVPQASYLTSNDLWFDNLNGVSTPVYAPSTFSAASIDHFDNLRSTDKFVMNYSLSKGEYYRYLHQDEANALVRLGYDINISMATAVEDLPQSNSDARIYPNPATSGEGVKINLQGVNKPEILVVVYDMLGRVSYSKVVMNKGSGPLTAIDPHNNLAPGMYIVIGSSKDELFNQKLVIE